MNYATIKINQKLSPTESVTLELVNDPEFVELLQTTVENSLDNYSYYLDDLGEEQYNSFVNAVSNPENDPQQTFTNYGVQIDPFIDNASAVFAQAAITLNSNPSFALLDEEEQISTLAEAIGFYFPSTHGTPSGTSTLGRFSSMQKLAPSALLSEIGGCLFDAVGGYLIGNVRIIRDIYGAISGSSMGYAFVYAMAGRILRQSLTNAGGWFGIAASFAWCMIF